MLGGVETTPVLVGMRVRGGCPMGDWVGGAIVEQAVRQMATNKVAGFIGYSTGEARGFDNHLEVHTQNAYQVDR